MKIQKVIRNYPATAYFVIVMAASYGSFIIAEGPTLLQGNLPKASVAEYILFPILVWSVCLTGLLLTALLQGKPGLRNLAKRIFYWHVPVRWFVVALLTPLTAELLILTLFRTFISIKYTPNFFLLGILFGVLPGLLEEIGWMGFAFPRLRSKRGALPAALILGLLWGLWHAPVVDYLGTAAPHRQYWLFFFLAFVLIVMAIRVLMVWIYTNTRSILLVQIMHISMTASLVIFDPTGVSAAQEALWYFVYATLLWSIAGFIVYRYGLSLEVDRSKSKVSVQI